MKYSKVDRSFLLGLLLFTHQMQLSIDRSKWSEFVAYANSEMSIKVILKSLKRHFPLCEDNAKYLSEPRVNYLDNLFIRKNCLFDIEQRYIFSWLFKLGEYLEKNEEIEQEVKVQLRLNLAYCGDIIQKRVSKYSAKYSLVEHLNQNEILKTQSINELLGKNWPN